MPAVTSGSTRESDGRPAYEWRGLSLDVARHFFAVDDIDTLIDLAADLELNRFHLHLSDDQGWRIEVPARPQLVRRSSSGAVDGDPGGFYTLRDWRHLQDHARHRGIVLIPEIDVPGHTNAALHAVPGLNIGETPKAYTGIDVGFSTLHVDAPETEAFLRDVLGQAAEMGEGWVHIGGDESHATPRDEYEELVRMAVRVVHDAGARVIAWQEAAGLLESGDIVQVWADPLSLAQGDEQVWADDLSIEGVTAASHRGVGVLMSPASHIYLDMKYAEGDRLGLTWAGTVELQRALEWDPADIVRGVDPASIVGVEAAVWTETIRTFDEMISMLLPRLAAAADVAWNGSGVGRWESFREDVADLGEQWSAEGLAFHRSPGVDWRD